MTQRIRRAPTQEQIQEHRERTRRSLGVTGQTKSMISENADLSLLTPEAEAKYHEARLAIMKRWFGHNGGEFRIFRRRKGEDDD